MSAPYPSLEQLFGGYLHQDYRAEHEDVASAVRAYAKDNPAEIAVALLELERLRKTLHGPKLAARLERMGLAYDPSAAGETHEQLLDRVQELLRQPR